MTSYTYLALQAGVSLKEFKGGIAIMGARAITSTNTARAIKKLRYKLGQTQKELAGSIGVSTSTVKSWESGRAMPSPKHYKAMEDYIFSDEIYEAGFNKLWDFVEAAREQDLKTAEMASTKAGEQQ